MSEQKIQIPENLLEGQPYCHSTQSEDYEDCKKHVNIDNPISCTGCKFWHEDPPISD